MRGKWCRLLVAMVFLFVSMFVAGVGRAQVSCDKKCRERTTFFVDNDSDPLYCVQYTRADCDYCATRTNGKCHASGTSYPGPCSDAGIAQYSRFIPCNILCPLIGTKPLYAEAVPNNPTGTYTKQNFNVYLCEGAPN